jgi:hypothetical protein
MMVQLGVVCTGTVRVKETLNKVDVIEHSGKMHFQYNDEGADCAKETGETSCY